MKLIKESIALNEDNNLELTKLVLNTIDSNIDDIEGTVEKLFDILVPPTGNAESTAGELTRAISKLIYRYYNDGDVFYKGYGIETCGNAIAFIVEKLESLDSTAGNMQQIIERVAENEYKDEKYETFLLDIADSILYLIAENPELITDNTNENMYDTNAYWIEELEPRYEEVFDIPYRIEDHINAGNIEIDEIANWEEFRDITIEDQRDQVYLSNMTEEQLEDITDNWNRWMNQWANDLDEEFGIPGLDESLKEGNMNRYKVDYTIRDRNKYGLHFKKGTRTVTATTEVEAKEKIEQDLVDKIYVDNIKLVESLTEGAANFGTNKFFNLSSPKEEFDEDNYDFDPYEDGYLFIKDQLEGLGNYIKVEPGYYEGYYIDVRFDDVEDFLNEIKDEEFYNFSDYEINPNELLEEANKRINEIKEALTKSIQYGYLTNYAVSYRFSSGETGYQLINETKKDLELFNKEITDFAKEVKEEILKNIDKGSYPYNITIFGWNDRAEQFTDVEYVEEVYDLEEAKKITEIKIDKAFRYYDDVYAEVRDKDGNVVHTTKIDLEEAADPKALKKLGMPTKAEAENIDIKHPTKDEAEKELKLKDERTFELDKAFAGKLKEEIDVEGLKAQIKELEELEDKTVEQFTELKNLQDKLNLKEEKTDNTLIIKQALVDLDNEDYHDLVNMYEAITLTEKERLELANLLSGKGDIIEVYDFLVTRLNETFNYEFK